jgi:hypothetical protein
LVTKIRESVDHFIYFILFSVQINKDERECACAAREVEEEIGFDVSGRLVEEDYLEATRGGQYSRLYIIPDVPESTCFMTQTKGEIGMIAWHDIAALPTSRCVTKGVPCSLATPMQELCVSIFLSPLHATANSALYIITFRHHIIQQRP